ncbi:NAD(P)/FAD-dependent oxidoreductase [Metabacillus herbersteinensis]|uniref:NAD(P)/FAD-dependent oxidoreductase n=1 Tax=Metabacillus herbersteinensis TaxID=283816 RepID=A0ABV6GKM3_9BACI
METKIAIVGAGPAGIGLGILLEKVGFKDYVILEKYEVGATFFQWPKEMKLITPSFIGHGFGSLDLNSIAPETSPAFSFEKEHLTGEEYGTFLQMLSQHFKLKVEEDTEVKRVEKKNGYYRLHTDEGCITAEYVIWATGEYQFPNSKPFEGAELAIHNSEVESWAELDGDEFTIIGGYESGIDAGYHLVMNKKSATVFSRSSLWESEEVDPSLSLSPYTKERLVSAMETNRLQLKGGVEVLKIEKAAEDYVLYLSDGSSHKTKTKPILATGFIPGAKQIQSFFEWDETGVPLLSEQDESTESHNLFLIGPNVRHKEVIFCFIYKFRQRFAVVAKEILDRAGADYNESVLEHYRKNNMFLDDLTCCEVKCEC